MSTKIEWTDEVWNVVTGCTHSGMSGCDNCYAKRLFPRVYGGAAPAHMKSGRKFSDVRTHPDRLDQPLHWRKPRRVFACSMGDLFHKAVPDAFIAAAFGVMAACPQHTFLVLTKRLERALALATSRAWVAGMAVRAWRRTHGDVQPDIGDVPATWPLPNVWLGASASTQADLERVVSDLLATPAAVRFLSLEPMLEAIDIGSAVGVNWVYSAGAATVPHPSGDGRGGWWVSRGLGELPGDPPKIDWIVCGGESGPNARRCDIAWFRSVAEQCKAAGVACFLKQLGSNPGRKLGKVWHPWCHGKGKHNDMADFPKDLRVREMP